MPPEPITVVSIHKEVSEMIEDLQNERNEIHNEEIELRARKSDVDFLLRLLKNSQSELNSKMPPVEANGA